MQSFDELKNIVARLRAEDGCPWDRAQTHASLKAGCIEEAAEVICGVNVLEATGEADNLKEELGDLILQAVMHAQIAEEEGLFTLDDVLRGLNEKLIRRHPHVFGDTHVNSAEEALSSWSAVKAKEKEGKTDVTAYLPEAFREAKELIDRARVRKGL